MPISSLAVFFSVVVALVGIRVALFKMFKPAGEQPAPPVDATTAQAAEETLPPVSVWPVVVLLGVIVGLVIGLMLFGNAIGG